MQRNFLRIVVLTSLFTTAFTTCTVAQQWNVYNTQNSGLQNNFIGYGTNVAIFENGFFFNDVISVDEFNNIYVLAGPFSSGTSRVMQTFSKETNQWTTTGISDMPSLSPDSKIITLYMDKAKHPWLSFFKTDDTFDEYQRSGTNWSFKSKGGYVFTEDGTNNIWTANLGKLFRYDGTTVTEETLNTAYVPVAGLIIDIQFDGAGNYWALMMDTGNNKRLLVKKSSTGTTVYDNTNSTIFNTYPNTIEIGVNNKLWIGTAINVYSITQHPVGIASFDGTTWQNYNTTNSAIPSDSIYCIKHDAQDRIWVGTANGLARFDGTSWLVYKQNSSPLPSKTVRAIAIDTLGNKWLGTPDGLVMFNEITPDYAYSSCLSKVEFQDQSVSIDGSITTWKWDFAGLGTSSAANPTFTFPAQGEYDVRLWVKDVKGNRNMITRKITVTGGQQALSLGPDIDVCSASAQLASNVTNAGSYQWQTPGGTIVGQQSITANQSGRYILEINTSGCIQKDTVEVLLNHFTEGSFTVTAGTIEVPDNGSVLSDVTLIFANNSKVGSGFSWSFGDGTTSTDADPSHAYKKAGTYTVVLSGIDSRNCPIEVTRIINVQDLVITNAISPNGDGKNDKLYVEPFLYNAELKVINRWGQSVYETSAYQDDFSGSGLESGIYYYELYFKEIDKKYKGYVQIMK